MANILKFVARAELPRRAHADGGVQSQCRIIILPCVRYERWSDDGAKPTPQKKRKARRRGRSR